MRNGDGSGLAAARPKVVALGVDTDTLASLRQAFPDNELDVQVSASPRSLLKDWDPADAALVVLGGTADPGLTLGLCRGLRGQAGRARTPVVVLVLPGHEGLVRAALEAGADGCLVLPVHPKELVAALARILNGNQPGRHTRDLDRAQHDDAWRDEGGEA